MFVFYAIFSNFVFCQYHQYLINFFIFLKTSSEKSTQDIQPARHVTQPKEEWAVHVDIKTPVDDFYKRIPVMAKKVGG